MASSERQPVTSSAPCCPQGSWEAPLDPSGPPSARGKMTKLGKTHEVAAYVTSPPGHLSSSKAIIVFTDVWGISDRLMSICDTFAAAGYYVIMPDCFRGETIATNPDITAWLSKYPYNATVSVDIDACVGHLASEAGADDASSLSIGALGFCWGAWALAKASAEGAPLRCGVAAHPSTGIERRIFGGDEGAMLEAARMPILLLPAGNDDERLKSGGKYAACLERKGGGCIDFEEMMHGWVSRGDLSVEEVRRDAERALTAALDFFQKNL